ncbi:GNAT family N-acetyltransferase [Enteractinococcus coprophilus]|nr:GNAT family N-acetyltransferase [Enteractinococcus coprophilus]
MVEVDGEIIGRVSTRHKLNEYLLNFDGHIGYAIAPEFRGRGYTKQIL